MNYEKEYKKRLDDARYWHDVSEGDIPAVLEEIFSELRESEDEKIRKLLIKHLEQERGSLSNDEATEAIAWLEKLTEQKSIMNVPSREVILSIWDLGNEWKELTNGCISTEHGTQLDYIQKHWHESEYYLREKFASKESICSKEDESNLNEALSYIKDGALKEFVKSLIPWKNITNEELVQARKEAYNEVLDKIEYHDDWPTFDDGWNAAIWYLKKRNTMPQNQWKPSEEQITWLYRAADDASKDSRMKQILNELLSDLKKLK